MTLDQIPGYLLPWEFAITWLLACLVAVVLYLRGMVVQLRAGETVGFWRPLAFLVGVVAMYVVTHTHYDYLAQYMFFTHRAQHLVLHHAAPFLIALSAPLGVLAAGVPAGVKALPGWRGLARALMPAYRFLQHPIIAPVLFVGLIYFWLIPSIHFDAMLSSQLYQVMNWSMALDGLLFWWLVLDPRSRQEGGLGYGWRVAALLVVVPPQIVLGAYIMFSDSVLFDVYEVCGRAWPLAPITDQQIGGLITWIPASMMSVIGLLVILGRIFRDGRNEAKQSSFNDSEKHHVAI